LTRVYRILRRPFSKKPLDGKGAYRFGGRWSSAGVRLAYTAEHLSLAMIEYFVHINVDGAPRDLAVVAADIPASVSRIAVAEKQLPKLAPDPGATKPRRDRRWFRGRRPRGYPNSALGPRSG
jgi:RES domain-containing protein